MILHLLSCSFHLLLPSLLVVVFFFFLRSTTLKRRQQSHNLPPGPTPLPFICNLLKFGRLPHVSLRNLAVEHGPLMHLTLGQIPAIVASSKETATEILRTQDHIFCSRPQLIASSHLSYGGHDINFSPYNDHWKQLERFSNAEFFGASKVQSFRTIRDEEVANLANTIRSDCSDGKAINLSKIVV